MATRHQAVFQGFQRLNQLVHNAAVSHPDMIRSQQAYPFSQLFITDSIEISRQVQELRETAVDTQNLRTLGQLHSLIGREVQWLLKSNVPDSILHQHGREHLAALLQIDALISKGTRRTTFLVSYRQQQIAREMRKVQVLIVLFVILSCALLIYTTAVSLKQYSKRKNKEQELAMVLNTISDGVISIDAQWRYTFLNDAAMANHAGEKASIVGQSIWTVHPGLEESAFGQKYREAFSTGQIQEVESFFAPLKSWFAARIYPSAEGLTIYYQDVTEKRKAADAMSRMLKEIKDYRFALDEASIVAITDQKGIISHANENFCRISGYKLEELIGKDHRIINSGYHSKEFIRNLWVTIANGKIWKGELRNRAKDGTIYWVDTTIVPFLNEEGKPYQYIAIRADITQRKEAQERLLISERTYKTIASSIPGSVICLLDRDFRYRLIEGDMLEKLGFSKSDLLGKQASEALPPEVFNELEPQLKGALAGRVMTREMIMNGFDIVARYIPLKDASGEVDEIMTVAMDVTKLKQAQRDIGELNTNLEGTIALRTEELRKSNEELESFSYSVSHDLRAPLRGIIGFAAVLKEEYGGTLDEEADRIIQIIQQSAGKMGQLIDDLLAFSRTGKQALQKSMLNTTALVAEVIQECSRQDLRQTVRWEVGELPGVNADLNSLRQVWSNLLSNAIKYSSTKERPCIQIGASRKANTWEFFVKDNGVGFDQKYKHKLFGVFQRLHDADEFEGTGVGLALVNRIITKHGGTIRGEGKPGEGACFTFSLPA
jgi:PAS domain S-box-containing protein